MCGIAGIVSGSLAASGAIEPAVGEMLRRLRHRGPDGSGVAVHGAAALGAARLAIVDVREIPQPFTSRDGSFVLAYNGEVYNFRELRAELEEREGVRFATGTDTEVVCEALRAWGTAALSRFHGMFAFVLLDVATGRLLGARDRLGKKPFFYAHRDGLFAFASFVPSLGAVPGLELTPDLRSLFDVVELGYSLSPKSPYREVAQLPPACWFTLEDGRLTVREYWSLAEQFRAGAGLGERGLRRAAEDLDEALRDSVRMRLVSDVPLGVLLSGGLDSSIVAALMTTLAGDDVRSFSVAFEERGFDESAHAERVARHLGSEHHVDTMSLDDPSRLDRALWHVGEPLADTSVLPTWLVGRLARRHVTVALGGDGADELFAGYETFRADALLQLLHYLPQWPLRPMLQALADRLPADHDKVSLSYRVKRFMSGWDLPPHAAHYHWRALMDHASALACFTEDARRELAGYSPVERFGELDREVDGCDLVNRCSYVDLRTYLLDDILVKVDRCTMAHSLEGRSPFLDHAVVSAAARLPGRMKLRGATTKWILREQHGHRLPSETLRRSKSGFSAPVARWLTGPLRERFLDTVTRDRMASLGLDHLECLRLHERLEAKQGHEHYKVWALFVLALWSDLRLLSDAPPA